MIKVKTLTWVWRAVSVDWIYQEFCKMYSFHQIHSKKFWPIFWSHTYRHFSPNSSFESFTVVWFFILFLSSDSFFSITSFLHLLLWKFYLYTKCQIKLTPLLCLSSFTEPAWGPCYLLQHLSQICCKCLESSGFCIYPLGNKYQSSKYILPDLWFTWF